MPVRELCALARASGVFSLVDVDLQEDDVFEGLGHLLDLRGDHLAGTAPRREEVDDDLQPKAKAFVRIITGDQVTG